jgi:hypothetical protein
VPSSYGQPFARAHWSTCRWPLAAAAEHVYASHGQPSVRAHCSTARCLHAAAIEQESSPSPLHGSHARRRCAPRALHAAHARVDALHVRADALQLCIHDAHQLAHLQEQAEQLGSRLVLGPAAVGARALASRQLPIVLAQ